MNHERLVVYINDHLAGAVVATEMLERLVSENKGEELSQFAAKTLAEIEADEEELKTLLHQFDGVQEVLKSAAAWTGAKITAPKLSKRVAGDFGNFEALEILSVGILGKRALWRMLDQIKKFDTRLAEYDYARLLERAESQYQAVEEMRQKYGVKALTTPPE